MRYIKIFLLYFERVFQYRSMIFVWFLVSLFHPLIYLMFWKGRMLSGNGLSESYITISTYYLFFIVAGGFFVHVDADAYYDMVQGNLSMYMMKPFSYLKIKFFSELPWRFIQGFLGLVALLLLVLVAKISLNVSLTPATTIVALLIAIGGYLVMFLFKMVVLVSALWMEDIGGLQQFVQILIIIFAGFIMPIRHFPPLVAVITNLTPFPYMVYYPVIAFQGQLGSELPRVIVGQITWIVLLFAFYQVLWKRGIQRYNSGGI